MRIAILNHLIYELKKGVRDLGLLTLPENLLPQAIECLNKRKISFFTVPLHNQKTNLFFGDDLAVKIAMSFNTKLDKLSPEEDFILGCMLGYSKNTQYKRFINKKSL